MSLAALRAKYREVFEEETRCRHREHLFRRIAWRLQALAEGDLTERARERASQLAGDADLRMVAPRDFFTVEGAPVRTTRQEGSRPADCRLPLPGTLLSRKWKGRTILVEVLPDGFRFENHRYASLSAVAVAVTGTRWNGLAFFGLTGKGRKEHHHAQKGVPRRPISLHGCDTLRRARPSPSKEPRRMWSLGPGGEWALVVLD